MSRRKSAKWQTTRIFAHFSRQITIEQTTLTLTQFQLLKFTGKIQE